MNPLTYLHLQMRLEGKELVNEHFMRQVEVVPDEEMPLILIAQQANEESVVYYDEAISLDLQKELAASILDIEFPKADSLLNVLQSRDIQFEIGHYKTYVFPSRPAKDMNVICLSKHDPKVKVFGFDDLLKIFMRLNVIATLYLPAFPRVRISNVARHGCIQTLHIAIRASRRKWSTPGRQV